MRESNFKNMKRVNILESQYDGVLMKYQVDDSNIKAIENDRLSMDIVDTKQKSRESIDKAFNLGIKYAKSKNDLYVRKKIKKELDDMVQALDDI